MKVSYATKVHLPLISAQVLFSLLLVWFFRGEVANKSALERLSGDGAAMTKLCISSILAVGMASDIHPLHENGHASTSRTDEKPCETCLRASKRDTSGLGMVQDGLEQLAAPMAIPRPS